MRRGAGELSRYAFSPNSWLAIFLRLVRLFLFEVSILLRCFQRFRSMSCEKLTARADPVCTAHFFFVAKHGSKLDSTVQLWSEIWTAVPVAKSWAA